MRAVVTLVSFVAILWTLSGPFTIPGVNVTVPGYMVWAALLYAIVGTWLTDRIGRPLVTLNFNQQRYEADFRFSLVRFRENTEASPSTTARPTSCAGSATASVTSCGTGGPHAPAEAADLLYRGLRAGRHHLPLHGGGAALLPRRVRAGRAHADRLRVRPGAGLALLHHLLVHRHRGVARGGGEAGRLQGSARPGPHRGGRPGHSPRRVPRGRAGVEHVHLALPGGRPSSRTSPSRCAAGIPRSSAGPRGGKSTLFRAIAGIWPFGYGRITMPAGARVLFLPQKPYLPLGAMREVLTIRGLRSQCRT